MTPPCDRCGQGEGRHFWISREGGVRTPLHLYDACWRRVGVPRSADPEDPGGSPLKDELNRLVPKRAPVIPGYEFTWMRRPSPASPGTCLDVSVIDPAHVGCFVASSESSSSKSLAAMLAASLSLQGSVHVETSPSETLKRVNSRFHPPDPRGTFVTAFCVVLSHPEGVLTMASAGHEPLVHWSRSSRACRLINPNGLALGIDRGPLFEKTLREEAVRLEPGDRFVLYTGGLVECRNAAGEEFGVDRFYRRIGELCNLDTPEFISRLIGGIDAHRGEAPQTGDFLLLTGRRLS